MIKKILRCLLVIWVAAMLLSIAATITAEETDMQQLSRSNAMFAFDLYGRLCPEPGNLFFSPYGISTALAMTYAGARGTTAQQIAETLHFELPPEALHPAFASLTDHLTAIQRQSDIVLNVANALWIQQGFEIRQAFLEVMDQFYAANLFQENFVEAAETVREKINAWVAEQTNNKIKNLLPPGTLNDLTRLVLTNAIYFKGTWNLPFNPDATAAVPFWISSDQSVEVDMMYQQAVLAYGEIEGGQILILPYADGELTMLIMLPHQKNGLATLEQQLTVERLQTWTTKAESQMVKVYLPKFRIESQFNLSATLKALGMPEAFSEKADFSGMAIGKPLSISDVLHKAFVEVNEEGTEAAAATSVVVGVTSVMEPQPIPVFRADHPFLFMIQDTQSGSIIFLGRVMNPKG